MIKNRETIRKYLREVQKIKHEAYEKKDNRLGDTAYGVAQTLSWILSPNMIMNPIKFLKIKD